MHDIASYFNFLVHLLIELAAIYIEKLYQPVNSSFHKQNATLSRIARRLAHHTSFIRKSKMASAPLA